MTHVLSLGAINKHTREYVYPKIANKKDEYICPECNKDLILVKGEVRVHHFRHKVDTKTPCNHYNKPTETQIHKDAKILLKTLLERKIPISFIRKCCECTGHSIWKLPEIKDNSVIKLEHRFEFNGPKIADVAWLNDDKLYCIFEICNTHKTRNENRPEPWFEIDAETLITNANDDSLTLLEVPCIRRQIICGKCREYNNKKQAIRIIASYIKRNIYKQKYVILLENTQRKKKERELYTKERKKLEREKKEREKNEYEIYEKEYEIYEKEYEIYKQKEHEIRENFRKRQLNFDDELNKVTTLKTVKYYENIAIHQIKKCDYCASNNNRCFTCITKISKLGKDMRIKHFVSGLEQQPHQLTE